MKIETKIKLVFWHLAILTLAFWFWMYVDYILNVITPDSWRFDFEPLWILTFVGLTAIMALGSMLFHHWQWTMSFFVVNALMYLAFFGFTWLTLTGVVFAAFMNLESFRVISEELRERTKVNSGTTLRRGLTSIVISFFLLISFAAYESPVLQSIQSMDRIPTAGTLIIENIVDMTLRSQFDIQNEEDKQFVIGRVTQETVGRLNTILAPYFRYAPPVLSFALFLVLWGASWIFIWAAVWIGQIGYVILKKTKFFSIQERDIKAETLVV